MTERQQAQIDLAARVEGRRPAGQSDDRAPGPMIYWRITRHIRAEDVLFADLEVSDASRRHLRAGRIFLITKTAVIFVRYNDAAPHGNSPRVVTEPGEISFEFYPRGRIKRLTVEGRDLRVLDGVGAVEPDAQPKTIKLEGEGWQVQLPGETVYDGDDYLEELLAALDLASASTTPH